MFWRRDECIKKQGSILVKHLFSAGMLCSMIGLIGWIYSARILNYYKIDERYLPVAIMYLKIGLVNMALQAIYGGLDGMLVASQQQNRSMFIAGILAIANIIIDHYAVYALFSGRIDAHSYYSPMLIIATSTTIFLLVAILISLVLVVKKVQGWEKFLLKEMMSVWSSELGTYIARGSIPFIYAYQLCFVNLTPGFLVTYQLALHISYLFCFPLVAAMQIAVRDGSAKLSGSTREKNIPSWWSAFLYTGLAPTTLLLGLGIIFSVSILKFSYGYTPPVDHMEFLAVFFMSCWVGQLGNTYAIPLRIAKKNYLVTKNFIIAEFMFMIGGTQFLIFFGVTDSFSLGCIIFIFSIIYFLLNFIDVRILSFQYRKDSV